MEKREWLEKEYLVSAEEMKEYDKNTIEYFGVPSLVLMERAALAAAEAQLPCPEVPETVTAEAESTTLFPTVRFKLNSAYVSSEEMVNVYNIAEYMKANPNAQIVVRGYADKDTGTSDYNMELSKRRAEAVKNELINTYGISADRLETKAFGSDVQEYPSHNDWNRIVIFKQ